MVQIFILKLKSICSKATKNESILFESSGKGSGKSNPNRKNPNRERNNTFSYISNKPIFLIFF